MILLRCFLLLGGVALLGLVAWTQTVARTYGYHPALGAPLWVVEPWPGLTYPLYGPWQALVWQWYWGAAWVTWLGLAGMSLVVGLAVAGWRWVPRSAPPPLEGHGQARWATRQDVRKAGLL